MAPSPSSPRTYSIPRLLALGVAFHLIYIASVFDCYFTSPIVHGMKPHRVPLARAPAKRLVLIVGWCLPSLLTSPSSLPPPFPPSLPTHFPLPTYPFLAQIDLMANCTLYPALYILQATASAPTSSFTQTPPPSSPTPQSQNAWHRF